MTCKYEATAATAVAMLKTDEQTARRVAALFAESVAGEDSAVSFVDEGRGGWRVTVHFRAGADEQAARALAALAAGPAAAKALRFERIAAEDWVGKSLAGLQPVRAGRFVVHGAHDRARIPPNRIGIEIEAALAFGTGHHGTTHGCLLALDGICKVLSKPRPAPVDRHPEARAKRASKDVGRGAPAVALRGSALRAEHLRVTERVLRILDLGTGSGVLAIAAALALRQPVLALDIDADAVRAAAANARRNRAAALVETVKADAVAGQRLRGRGRFDLVFANILLGPLQRLAAPLQKIIAPGARVILSGLLPAQANAALAAYRGLALERRIELDGWTTLVLARRRPRRRPPGVAGRHRAP